MDWSQQLFISALIVATIHGRFWKLAAVMWFNLILTVALASAPLMVGIADLICATTLMLINLRGMVLSALFLVMIPVYVVFWLFGWPISATYATVDAIAVLQLLVLGNVDKYLRNVGRGVPDNRGRRGTVDSLAAGHPAQVGRTSEADGR